MSNHIDTQIKDIILGYYEKPFWFLKKIDSDYPTSKAAFQFDGKQYTKTVRPRLSGTNSIILISQTLLCALCSNIHQNKIPELKGFDLPINKTANCAECLVISRYHNIAFKRPITLNQEEPFELTLTIDKVIHKLSKGLTFFKISYEICNRSFTGNLTVTFNANRFK